MLNRRSILTCLGFLPAALSAKLATFVGEPVAPPAMPNVPPPAKITLADFNTIPEHPLTDAEFAGMDYADWTLYSTDCRGVKITRFPVYMNAGYWVDNNGDHWTNVTNQSLPIGKVQVMFYKYENGVRMTQPLEVVPTEKELKSSASHREDLLAYRAEKRAKAQANTL